jgi:hypothetical protein
LTALLRRGETRQIEWKEEAPDSLMLAPLNLYGELSELFEFS